MSFFGSLFGGQNDTLSGNIKNFGNIGGFASSVGQGDTSQASNFWSSILGGDPTQISKVLAPQIDTMQKQGQQQLQTASQFGDRSGGGNAAAQMNTDTTRGNIDNMISGLTGSAASNLGNMGQNLLGTSLSAYGMQDQASQQQMQNWMNSILGKGISGGIGAAEGFGLGAGMNALSPSTFQAMMGH